MDIEQTFAAEVLNARGGARLASTAGIMQTASDQVEGALAELWKKGTAAGMTGDAMQAIADRWVEWDAKDRPWPRSPSGNVIALR
jgi:hypothetical protein